MGEFTHILRFWGNILQKRPCLQSLCQWTSCRSLWDKYVFHNILAFKTHVNGGVLMPTHKSKAKATIAQHMLLFELLLECETVIQYSSSSKHNCHLSTVWPGGAKSYYSHYISRSVSWPLDTCGHSVMANCPYTGGGGVATGGCFLSRLMRAPKHWVSPQAVCLSCCIFFSGPRLTNQNIRSYCSVVFFVLLFYCTAFKLMASSAGRRCLRDKNLFEQVWAIDKVMMQLKNR